MDKERNDELRALQERIGYLFSDVALLDTALTHTSFVNENQGLGYADNERLEFLGDSVLQLSISELLFERFPAAHEGTLSKIRASLVTEQSLAEVALSFGIGQWLLLGKGEDGSGGREKPSILANAFEAIIAAIFLDGGYQKVRSVMATIFGPLVEHSEEERFYRDAKSHLQEISQARFKLIPHYALIEEYGPDHDKTFEIEVTIGCIAKERGLGKSKKEAEQKAATKALESLADEGCTTG